MGVWIKAALAWLTTGGTTSFAGFYADSLRSDLFAGFLTLCAFLYSVKTFLLVTLQKDVYGTPEYGRRIAKLKQVKKTLGRYTQLKRLNRNLFWAVVVTFIAAAMNLTVGLIDTNWAALLCVIAAVIAGLVVAYNLYVQWVVIKDWLAFLEDQPEQPEATPQPQVPAERA
jgi:hypothetical protein